MHANGANGRLTPCNGNSELFLRTRRCCRHLKWALASVGALFSWNVQPHHENSHQRYCNHQEDKERLLRHGSPLFLARRSLITLSFRERLLVSIEQKAF
jgi:hypothetical protein